MPLGLIAVRALHFWSVAVLLGGGGLLTLVDPRKVRSGVLTLRIGSFLAAVTGAAWFALTFSSVTGAPENLLDPESWTAFLASPFGPPWAVQLMLDATGLLLCLQSRSHPFVIVGALLAVDQAWLGHAAAGSGATGATMIASYAAHVLAGFVWVGALTMLCVAIRSPDALREGLARVSTLGLFLVTTILASGCLNASFRIAQVSDLTTTPYGRIILVKIVLFAAMLVLAAFNRRGTRRARIDVTALALSLGLETALGLLVLGAAAILGITAPAA